LLDAGMALFEALYQALTQARRVQGPTPVASRRTKSTRPGGKRR
jgi:hypothetical protein